MRTWRRPGAYQQQEWVMGLRAGLTAVLVAMVLVPGAVLAQPGPTTRKKPDWPTMKPAQKKFIKVKKPAPAKKKPAETWPGLIGRAEKAFGLSVVLKNSRHDFFSEDVKRVVIGLDPASGRILGLVIVKDDATWGLYVAPAYLAFFPNKRVQARRARLVWLDAAGWAQYLRRRIKAYDRD
jgi:hypothetical protein